MTLERFHFKGVDGTDHDLPKQIPGGALRAARNLAPLDQAFTILERAADDETLAAWDELPASEGMAILNDWFQGVSAPNSSSSSK